MELSLFCLVFIQLLMMLLHVFHKLCTFDMMLHPLKQILQQLRSWLVLRYKILKLKTARTRILILGASYAKSLKIGSATSLII